MTQVSFAHEKAVSTPKDFFLQLLATVTLYMSVVSFIGLLFADIDVLFPDALSYQYSYVGTFDSIRYWMAMLIVSFPVYLGLSLLITRDITHDPLKAEIAIRKWLLYLTIFLAAVTIIVDVIILLYNFLNGELSVRFYLKVLVVLLVAMMVFTYALWNIRERGEMRQMRSKILAGLAGTLVLASIIGSFLVAGSPWYQRQIRFDERRVQDLQNLQYQIVEHWRLKNTLPRSLDDLKNSISGFMPPVDPETGAPYGYRIEGPLQFELCANFLQDSPYMTQRGQSMPMPAKPFPMEPYEQNWSHAAGEACFERTIDPDLYPAPDITRPVPVR